MSTGTVPDLTPIGWDTSVLIEGSQHWIVSYPGGYERFRHLCDRGDRGVIICAPTLSPGHQVTREAGTVSISPSILCPDCGTHGFVRDGRWVPA